MDTTTVILDKKKTISETDKHQVTTTGRTKTDGQGTNNDDGTEDGTDNRIQDEDGDDERTDASFSIYQTTTGRTTGRTHGRTENDDDDDNACAATIEQLFWFNHANDGTTVR